MKMLVFPFDINVFFDKCVKHKNIPKNDFEKQAILIKIIEHFEDKHKYAESEVNAVIKRYFDDYVTLRRELVNFNYLNKDSYTGEYWVAKRNLTEEDIRNNSQLRKHAKPFKVLEEDR